MGDGGAMGEGDRLKVYENEEEQEGGGRSKDRMGDGMDSLLKSANLSHPHEEGLREDRLQYIWALCDLLLPIWKKKKVSPRRHLKLIPAPQNTLHHTKQSI